MKAEDTECPIASLRIIYTPDTEYNEYTANWIISRILRSLLWADPYTIFC